MEGRQTAHAGSNMRVGVLGGSFNPIHHGHLHIARRVRDLFGMRRIYFVVTTFPPHKQLQHLVPFTHRYAMVSLATSRSPSLVPSLVELEPPASPFSIDTMAKLASTCTVRGDHLYFIAGTDSLRDVASWRDSRSLLESYNFIFVARPGAAIDDIRGILPSRTPLDLLDLRAYSRRETRRRIEEAEATPSVFLLDLRAPDISASRIRRLAAEGGRFDRLVPAAVRSYIRKLNLYGAK
jgi:nicotinate-nucleotide adenylyltransferase